MAHTPTIIDFQQYPPQITNANFVFNFTKVCAYMTAGTEDFTLNTVTTTEGADIGTTLDVGTNATVGGTLNVTGIVTGIGSGLTKTPCKVDRGDPAAYDYTVGDFTGDATWRDLDLSAIAPAGVRVVWLNVLVAPDRNATFMFRKKGNANAINVSRVLGIASNLLSYTFPVFCDANRVIQYNLSVATWTQASVVVVGWEF